VETLFRDLLIGVTNFFRDPKAFVALNEKSFRTCLRESSLAALYGSGCRPVSTGEEAYSLAILLQDTRTALKQGHKIQVFATDIDDQAIEKPARVCIPKA